MQSNYFRVRSVIFKGNPKDPLIKSKILCSTAGKKEAIRLLRELRYLERYVQGKLFH